MGSSLSLKSKQDYFVALGLGVIVSLHWMTYFASMQLSSVAIGMIAFFTYPVMTVLIEPLFNKSRLQTTDLICVIMVLIGVSLLIPEASLGNNITLGIVMGIISAMLFTARNLLHKRYFTHYTGAQAMFYQTTVAMIALLPWHETAISSIESQVWWLLILLGIFFTALPHALFTSALRQLSAKTVSLVSCLQPLYGALLALILLGEQLALKTIIGGSLVVATAIYETQRSHRAHKEKQ